MFVTPDHEMEEVWENVLRNTWGDHLGVLVLGVQVCLELPPHGLQVRGHPLDQPLDSCL